MVEKARGRRRKKKGESFGFFFSTFEKKKIKEKKDLSHPAARVEHDRAELPRAGHSLGEVGQRAAVEVERAPLDCFLFSRSEVREVERARARERERGGGDRKKSEEEETFFPLTVRSHRATVAPALSRSQSVSTSWQAGPMVMTTVERRRERLKRG